MVDYIDVLFPDCYFRA